MTRYCEYPEPIIAAYVQSVRSLPVPVDVADLSAAFIERSRTVPLRAKVALRFASWVVAATVRLSIVSATWTVSDHRAKIAYRSLLNELQNRGWPAASRQRVVHGLNALRGRKMTGAGRERLYNLSMERFVPRSTIGWH